MFLQLLQLMISYMQTQQDLSVLLQPLHHLPAPRIVAVSIINCFIDGQKHLSKNESKNYASYQHRESSILIVSMKITQVTNPCLPIPFLSRHSDQAEQCGAVSMHTTKMHQKPRQTEPYRLLLLTVVQLHSVQQLAEKRKHEPTFCCCYFFGFFLSSSSVQLVSCTVQLLLSQTKRWI